MSTSTLTLHYFPGACSLGPHIVAREAGIPIDLDKLDTETGKTQAGQDYSATVTAKGYVPALRIEDGTVLTEGAVISQYLADKAPQSKLIAPPGTPDRYRAQEWLNYVSSEVHKGFAPLFGDGSDAQKDAAREALAPKFAYIEGALRGKRFILGEQFSVVDAYLFTVLSWGKYTSTPLPAALNDYLGRVAARPAVQAALKAEGLI